jgi:hypothetical protein
MSQSHPTIETMKTNNLFRLGGALSCALLVFSSTSCVTTYDAAGRPVQTVDPAMAAAGVVAAGLVGYAISENNHSHYRGGYAGYGGGYYRPYRCY